MVLWMACFYIIMVHISQTQQVHLQDINKLISILNALVKTNYFFNAL